MPANLAENKGICVRVVNLLNIIAYANLFRSIFLYLYFSVCFCLSFLHYIGELSRVLISTCSAPLVQTGECKQFSMFDLDF